MVIVKDERTTAATARDKSPQKDSRELNKNLVETDF